MLLIQLHNLVDEQVGCEDNLLNINNSPGRSTIKHDYQFPIFPALTSSNVSLSLALPSSSSSSSTLTKSKIMEMLTPKYMIPNVQTLAVPNSTKSRCSCSRSCCLKLYCECFAAGNLCVNCGCTHCLNNVQNLEVRQDAIDRLVHRNPDAFRGKINHTLTDKGIHVRGCNCKRSGCLKNYCECYEYRIPCTSRCRCQNCSNTIEHSRHLSELNKIRPPTSQSTYLTQMVLPNSFDDSWTKFPYSYKFPPNQLNSQWLSNLNASDNFNGLDNTITKKLSKFSESCLINSNNLLQTQKYLVSQTKNLSTLCDEITHPFDYSMSQFVNKEENEINNGQTLTNANNLPHNMTTSGTNNQNENLPPYFFPMLGTNLCNVPNQLPTFWNVMLKAFSGSLPVQPSSVILSKDTEIHDLSNTTSIISSNQLTSNKHEQFPKLNSPNVNNSNLENSPKSINLTDHPNDIHSIKPNVIDNMVCSNNLNSMHNATENCQNLVVIRPNRFRKLKRFKSSLRSPIRRQHIINLLLKMKSRTMHSVDLQLKNSKINYLPITKKDIINSKYNRNNILLSQLNIKEQFSQFDYLQTRINYLSRRINIQHRMIQKLRQCMLNSKSCKQAYRNCIL